MHIYSFNDLEFTLKHIKRYYMFRSYNHHMIETCGSVLSVLM